MESLFKNVSWMLVERYVNISFGNVNMETFECYNETRAMQVLRFSTV